MALRSLPLLPPLSPLPGMSPMAQGPPARNLPTLWTQLEPYRRQELAQHLAEMIRHLRLRVCPTEPLFGQEATDDHR
jgi:hypothetical protein